MMRTRRAVLAVAAALLCVAAPVASQTDGWASLFPEAAGLGPPDWVRPGTRITYYQASASVPQTRGDDARGGSGEGATEVDIIAIDGTDVLVSMIDYQWNRETDARTYLPRSGGRIKGVALDTVWLHPTPLATLLEGAGPGGFDAVRMPYELLGTTFDAIRVTTGTNATTLDAVTGLVLIATTGTVTGGGGDTPNSEGSIQQLLASRTRETPGIGAAVPGWLARGTVLSYQGSWVDIRFQQQAAAQMELRFDAVGRDWAQVTATALLPVAGVPTRAGHTAVAGGAGPYWYDPVALAGMRQGDVLDTDAITRAQTTVTSIGQGPIGPAVTIVTQMPGSRLETTYDQASGMLLVYDVTLEAMFSRMRVELVGQS